MPRKGLYRCPFCGKIEMSKDMIISEILKLIGYGNKTSTYSVGNLSKTELLAIYNYIKHQKGDCTNAKA